MRTRQTQSADLPRPSGTPQGVRLGDITSKSITKGNLSIIVSISRLSTLQEQIVACRSDQYCFLSIRGLSKYAEININIDFLTLFSKESNSSLRIR
jgi:hypothetical protein